MLLAALTALTLALTNGVSAQKVFAHFMVRSVSRPFLGVL